jgi:hypothetical protein
MVSVCRCTVPGGPGVMAAAPRVQSRSAAPNAHSPSSLLHAILLCRRLVAVALRHRCGVCWSSVPAACLLTAAPLVVSMRMSTCGLAHRRAPATPQPVRNEDEYERFAGESSRAHVTVRHGAERAGRQTLPTTPAALSIACAARRADCNCCACCTCSGPRFSTRLWQR